VLLNNVDLAAILAEEWPDDFETLKASLPPWTLVLVVSGLLRRPEEKIAYEQNFLAEVIKKEFSDMRLGETLPGFPGLRSKMLSVLRNPWPVGLPHWKSRVKGACQSLFFHARPLNATYYVSLVEELAARHGYPVGDIGIYIQPIEHNRACRPEFSFFYDPGNRVEIEKIRTLYREAAIMLLNEGAVFTRPYGELASIVYERAASYAGHLKRLKRVFDPNNIMNPGNLCF